MSQGNTRKGRRNMQTSMGIERALQGIYYVGGPHEERRSDFGVSEAEVRMTVQVGDASPLHAGSPAKAILAAIPQADAEEYLNHQNSLVRFTDQTITDRRALARDLEEVRRLGYAVSYGERQAYAFSVAGPILQAGGSVFGAISICGPAQRFDEKRGVRYGELLRDAAKQISWELGYQGDWFDTDS